MNPISETDPTDTPSPQRHIRLGTWRVLVALFGAPTAWVAQIIMSEPVAAYVCYPFQEPLANPIWKEAPAILAAINIVCLVSALLSDFIAWTAWQKTSHNPSGSGIGMDSVEISATRVRFLAKLSLMSSFIFTMAVLFNIFAVLLVPLCSPWY